MLDFTQPPRRWHSANKIALAPISCPFGASCRARRWTMDFAGKGVVITGGSKGLGRALAHELGRRGARLVLVARDAKRLEEEARALAADVGDKEAIYPLAGAAQALLGRVDAIVHAASTLGASPLRPLADTGCEDFERALAVNVVGPFRLTKALLGPMALSGEGLV